MFALFSAPYVFVCLCVVGFVMFFWWWCAIVLFRFEKYFKQMSQRFFGNYKAGVGEESWW